MAEWVIDLVIAVLRVLLPWLVQRARDTASDAQPDTAARDRLRRAVRNHWLLGLLIVLCLGCGTRTVYVPHGTPVRLRETIPDAKVWVKDADGQVIPGTMDLPEGWYALPMPDDSPTNP